MYYEPANPASSPPAGGCQPGAKALQFVCLEWHPSFRNLGCYNDRSIRGAAMPSLHRDGRAIDVGVDVSSTESGDAMDSLVDAIVAGYLSLGVQQVIWYEQVWTVGKGWRDFTGSAGPHHDHAHIELTKYAAANLTVETAQAVLQEDELRDDQIPVLAAAIVDAFMRYEVDDHSYDDGQDRKIPMSTYLPWLKAEVAQARKAIQ